jgi:TP901 family phage tail tape measure protein
MAFTLQAVVALDGSKFTGGMTGMRASVQRFAGISMTMFGGVAGQVASMWAAFGPMGGVMEGLKAITTVGITYQKEMSNVASVSGLSEQAMRQLGAAAMHTAKTTSFTATDAAKALYQLASAGLQGADALSATLHPALLLAGATQSDTTTSTLLLTSAMAQFQIGADQARNMADLFAGAIASSPAHMQLLADAFIYAGPAGAAFKMSLKEVNDEVAAFHVVGLRGEQAGTAFRMALIQTQAAASSGAGAIGAALQGWSAEQEGLTGAIRRFEAAGIDGIDIIQQFGAKAGPGMAALLSLGSDAMKTLSERIEENADVGKMYATQMNNVSGRMDLFRSAVEVIAQKVFTVLSPVLMKLISTATLVVDALDKIGPVIAGLVDLIQNYGVVVMTWFHSLGAAAQGMVGGLGVLGVAVGILGPIFLGLAKVIVAASLAMLKSIMAFITPALVGIAAVGTAFAAFSLGQTVSNVKVGTDTIGGHLSAFFTRVIIFAERDAKLIALQFQLMMVKIRQYILQNAPELIEAFGRFLAPIIEKFGEFRAWILEKLNMDAAAAQVREASKDMADSLKNINRDDALDDVEQAAIRLRIKMEDISEDAATRLAAALDMAGQAAKDSLEGAIEPAEIFDAWLEQMDENGVKVKDTLLSLGADAKTVFSNMLGPVDDATNELGALGDAMGKIPKPAADMADAVEDGVKPVDGLTSSMTKLGKETLSFGKALLRMDQQTLSDIYAALKEFAKNLAGIKLDLGWMRDLAAFRLPRLDLFRVTTFIGALDRLVDGIKTAAGNAPDLGWMKTIMDFVLPGTGGFDRFVTTLRKFASDLGQIAAPALDWLQTIIDGTNLDTAKLKQVADIMSNLPTSSYNASVLIGWKDNYTLQSIDRHLGTIAGMKGVIWA